MKGLQEILANNQRWVRERTTADPDFFQRLAGPQTPRFLWIGCSDSRLPANEVMGLPAGEVFVHRNVANLMVHTDLNSLSVLEYGVNVLKIQQIIVCGHYGCGGIAAALARSGEGIIDNWLLNIRDTRHKYAAELDHIHDQDLLLQRLCEWNVAEQVYNVCHTSIVQQAWKRGQPLSVHGVIYDLHTGLLKELRHCLDGAKEISHHYKLNSQGASPLR